MEDNDSLKSSLSLNSTCATLLHENLEDFLSAANKKVLQLKKENETLQDKVKFFKNAKMKCDKCLNVYSSFEHLLQPHYVKMSLPIRIKKCTRLPWRDDSSNKTSSLSSTITSKIESSENTTNDCLRTSDFSNLSLITAITPPSYSVYENSEGEMINEKEGVKWPERPLTGYYSLKEYKKRKAFIKKNIREQEKLKNNNMKENKSKDIFNERQNEEDKLVNNLLTSCVSNGKCVEMGFCNMPNLNLKEENIGEVDYINGSNVQQSYVFCGVKSSDDVKSFIKNYNVFYLFYDNKKLDNKIQFEIPLKVAYFDLKNNDYIIKNVCKKYIEHIIKLPQYQNDL
ncbi:Hypothetical protein SRAE_2000194400 [Strongyloides ratti]|uniref:C2H2-type domain-containing protein n=1 Tax=Strongyloides ratti TaxID=34506 RepID=A0A090LIH2_STRRB|nr:Hypothetical protein SRAE_2000194400 [Strongyloides ratti]CEF67280.1 Hypothetical protein SRAE_2000194400 [Strongyloides ratti]